MLDIPLVQPSSKSDRSDPTRISKNENPGGTPKNEDADFDAAYAENESTVEAPNSDAGNPTSTKSDNENGDPLEAAPEEKDAKEEQTLSLDLGAEDITEGTIEPQLAAVLSETKAPPLAKSVATSELAFSQQVNGSGVKEQKMAGELEVNSSSKVVSQNPTDVKVGSVKAETSILAHADMHMKKNSPATSTNDVLSSQLQHAQQREGLRAAIGTIPKATADAVPVEVKSDPTRVAAHILPVAMQQMAEAPRREIRDLPIRVGPGQDQVAAPKKSMQATPPIAISSLAASQMKVANLQSSEGFELHPVASQEIDSTLHWETRSSSTTSPAPVTARAETAGLIGRQMAQVLQRLPDRPVELSLNPQELGRVRLSISAGDAGITVNVLAERPETLDLMRRNIDQLAIEFQSMGYQNINFAFADGQAEKYSGTESEGSQGGPQSDHSEHQEIDSPIEQLSLGPATGIDIRL